MDRIKRPLTVYFGPNNLVLLMEVDFKHELRVEELEETVARLDRNLRARHPELSHVSEDRLFAIPLDCIHLSRASRVATVPFTRRDFVGAPLLSAEEHDFTPHRGYWKRACGRAAEISGSTSQGVCLRRRADGTCEQPSAGTKSPCLGKRGTGREHHAAPGSGREKR